MNGPDAGYGVGPQIPPAGVDDALQWTPLSSVVPFSPDTIMLPALSSLPSSIYQTDLDRQTSRQHIDFLNHRAASNPNSNTVRQYYDNLSTQLSNPDLTQFRFKALPEAQSLAEAVDQRALELLRASAGGSFAEMIMARNNVSFTNASHPPTPQVQIPQIRHATATPARQNTVPPSPIVPTTPITAPLTPYNVHYTTVPQVTPKPAVPATPATPATPLNGVVRQSAFHVEIPIRTPTHVEPTRPNGAKSSTSPTPPAGSQIAEAVVIKTSAPIDKSEYVRIDSTMKQSKAFSSNNRKRKRAHFDADDDEPMAMGVDERAKADAELSNLQGLLEQIYIAEDNIQDGAVDNADASRFWLSTGSTEEGPILSNTIHHKLNSAMKKTIASKRFLRIPLDDLLRLERLCENALRKEELPSITPPTDPAEADMEDWLAKVGIVDNGLKTSKTVLRIMLGGRDEKQIYSEDLLNGVLRLTKTLIEESINPLIELRASSEQQDLYRAAFTQKKILGGLLSDVTSVLNLFAQMVAGEEAAESAITAALYMAASIVFIENASNEKDSIFGLQKVEMFRLAAMDVLTKIFARYPDQRSTIFEQILQNLEKLPVNRANARQFKLLEGGKNIQLVSALIMRLIQTSGTYRPERKKRVIDENGEGYLEREEENGGLEKTPSEAIAKLKAVIAPLSDSAFKNASSVIGYLVSKAMTSTKSGDQPYRHLLDIFTEDFLAVLGSPEWPGAELLLRALVLNMCSIVDNDKSAAVAKTMALDMLGLMGSGMCDLIVHLRESHRSRDSANNNLANISRLIDRYLDLNAGNGTADDRRTLEVETLGWEGPLRVALEHLLEAVSKDNTLKTSCGYLLTSWAIRVTALYEKAANEGEYRPPQSLARCASTLRKVITGKDWDDSFNLDDVSEFQVRQAYSLAVLNMPFCMAFEGIFNRLLRSVDDNQAQSRSKSLKSIMQLLAKDPTILNRTKVIPYIIKKAEDASPLVRDSAVDLLGKCIVIKPEIETVVCRTIISRASDTGVAVRKRAMKILKDIYLTTKKDALKVGIAEALIQRIKDIDSGVAQQAKNTFEEIWIAPFYAHLGDADEDDKSATEISPQLKLVASERVNIIVHVVQKEATLAALNEVIKSLVQQDNKNSYKNFLVCRTMVGSMFDDLLNKGGDENRGIRQNIMQTLTVFAKANPKLFSASQLELLQPYIENLTPDDLQLFRCVVIIYRFAVSILTSRQLTFLAAVQGTLLKSLTRVPIQELDEVISCLRNIGLVTKEPEKLIRVTSSCIKNITAFHGKVITDPADVKKVVKTLHILGYFGHYCDFEPNADIFKKLGINVPDTVSGLIAQTMVPLCAPKTHPEVRKAAVENLGRVCQTNAVHFLKPEILNIINTVFAEENVELKASILEGLRGFFLLEESRSAEEAASEEISVKVKKEAAAAARTKQLMQGAFATQNDGVSTSLAQTYIKEITAFSTARQDAYALVAVEVIASILRQGLVHPKEVVPCLIALETSTNPFINQIAYREHKALHSKHETLVERGYMEGVRASYQYQVNVAGSPQGATTDPFAAKLRFLYDVVQEGTRKIKKNFLTSLTSSIDFELAKFDIQSAQNHLSYAKYIIENLAFLDYATTEDVFQVVSTIEKLVAATGIIVAHAIETDVLGYKVPTEMQQQEPPKPFDPTRLKILSCAAATLTMCWAGRTYLRKSHGVNENKLREYRLGKVKANDPSMTKAPGRNPQVNANTVWEQIEGTNVSPTEAEQIEQCRQFVAMLSIDSDFKQVQDEDEEGLSPGTGGFSADEVPGISEAESVPQTPSKSRKRKGSEEAGGRKRKKPAVKRKK